LTKGYFDIINLGEPKLLMATQVFLPERWDASFGGERPGWFAARLP
jgi:hypothetical protein